ncbi:M48 family metalloprotease [Sphingomonas sp. QA11]|uniref:M48 family metallopeptidase n=1 Tax=Sphingomonas sp. QA11 TaxID=2950605 RepID=UPI00234B0E50|nr:M48 family metallopeptidase [Sphingomonas sp. QA11]WCM29273.1 M48 family metalloprotease [Sphingomonas sp. QA11]
MSPFRIVLAVTYILGALPADAKEVIPTLPPYTGAYQPQGVDERGVWMVADEEERALRDSKAVINDAKLNQYLHDVVCRVVGDARCNGVRIYVVRDAEFNASMASNGTLIVNTGLLLRVRNEAELAAVLGHEFGHFELRHSLLRYKRKRTASDIVAWAGVGAAAAVTYGSPSSVRSYQSIQLSTIGSVYAYNREQEREADLMSMAYLKSSVYDPRCFADIWDRLMDEADATAHGRKQQSTRYDRVAFFAGHPTSLERATYLRSIAAATGKAGEDDGARFREALVPWRLELLTDQLKLNDFEGTDYLIGELAGSQWTADLLFSRGELYRARGNPRDLVSAIGFYRDALLQDPTNADAYRGMGLAQMRSRDPAGAEALKKYLDMKPDAPDRAMISTLLQ